MIRFLLAIIFGLAIGVWEIAIRPMLPTGLEIPVLLPAVILAVITSKPSRSILMTVTATSFIGLYQIFSFDLIVFRWVGIVLIVTSLSRYWLTNRSVYSSVALGFIARLLDWASHYAISGIGTFFSDYSRVWAPQYIWYMTIFYDMVIIALGFFIIARMTNRFQISVQKQTGKNFGIL